MNGYLALILTGHVPYLRTAGREPEGEDLLHTTIADALVPTLNALFDLRELGLRPVVALAYSPVLLEQLQ
jgi:1,4-alpha-glucan branching enzyme